MASAAGPGRPAEARAIPALAVSFVGQAILIAQLVAAVRAGPTSGASALAVLAVAAPTAVVEAVFE